MIFVNCFVPFPPLHPFLRHNFRFTSHSPNVCKVKLRSTVTTEVVAKLLLESSNMSENFGVCSLYEMSSYATSCFVV